MAERGLLVFVVHVFDDGLQSPAADSRNICDRAGEDGDRPIVPLHLLGAVDRRTCFRVAQELVCQAQARSDHLSLLRQPFGTFCIAKLAI